ncbi:MAG: LLM class flavin-dependent oxidoreductase, partial [Acidimicrobiia bacterium]|nr:LLM class flavin-dependent oxidoreductase [Acidimicrobiia bacterium]
RHPLETARAFANIDQLSGGRLIFGAGVGWAAEEFEALGVPYDTRGARLNEWIEILRSCWTGRPEPRQSEHYDLPGGLLMFPTPAAPPPILVGGMSKAAVRRAGRLADGWLAFQNADAVDYSTLEERLALMRSAAADEGRSAGRVVVRLTGPQDSVVRALPGLARVGVDEVIIEVDWGSDDGPDRTLQRMRSSIA